jgi:hypothetical protein
MSVEPVEEGSFLKPEDQILQVEYKLQTDKDRQVARDVLNKMS